MDDQKYNILYVDDEEPNLRVFQSAFMWNYNIITAISGAKGLEILKEKHVALIITDQRMPGMTGVEFLEIVANEYPETIRILLTGYGDLEAISYAINQGGIFRYIPKPWDENEMMHILKKAIEIYQLKIDNKQLISDLKKALTEVEALKDKLEEENLYLREEIKLNHNFEEIVSNSKVFKKVLLQVEQVAPSDTTVLILGETGTGKELLARAVHNISSRRNQPLVKVNCATLPANLIESELFGHEKGAFTGAIVQKIGRFELANKGTIFLDEIGEMPLELQAKLLRVLQEGEFEKLGSSKTTKVNVRIIAATNRKLEESVQKGEFRSDLYYRLNVFPIKNPPLRERKEDIPILINHFVKKYTAKSGKQIDVIPKKVVTKLLEYGWPGNIRELENIIERAVVISQGKKLEIGNWFTSSEALISNKIETLEDHEKKYILEILKTTSWRVSGEKGAANLLGINAKTLQSRIKKLGIKRT